MTALKHALHRLLLFFGINLYWIRHRDRQVLEQTIFPPLVADTNLKRVLFIGCDWYTQAYQRVFAGKDYWTMDFDAAKAPFGAAQHVRDSLEHLERHFAPGSLDLIVCNGVFGWGLDAREAVESAFAQCFVCLRVGGLFVLGWNDIPERRPFALAQCQSLQQFTPYRFAPLGTAEYLTDTPYRHVFSFYTKRAGGLCDTFPHKPL